MVLLLSIVVGLLSGVCALALPFAPVLTEQATVSWPKAGEDPKPTTALFVSYAPAEIHVRIPCPVVRAALAAKRRTVVLTTAGTSAASPSHGLTVATENGRLRVQVGQEPVADEVPGQSDCAVSVDRGGNFAADRTQVKTAVVREVRAAPQVGAFLTDLPPTPARGMTVTARARNPFEATPTATKLTLIGLQSVLIVVSLMLLVGVRRGRWRWRVRQPVWRGRFRARLVDAGVVGSLGLWAFVGPVTADDGYAMLTLRNAAASGDIGNYYRWFNASEAPFTLWQRIIEVITPVSIAPLWLRLPSIVAGVLTWFVVSRGIVDRLLPRPARTARLRALTGLAFLAAWLPYGMGIRPEPLVTLGISVTFAFLLGGTAPGAPAGGLAHLWAAALSAGLTLGVTPSGIIVFAPVMVMAPRIYRALKADAPARRGPAMLALAGRLALLASPATAGFIAIFATQSWHGTSVSTKVHEEIGPNHGWHEETLRYEYLFSDGPQGTAVKRLFVVVCLALLLVMFALLAGRIRRLPGLHDVHLITVTLAGGFILLPLAPSKWSHHFGAFAGLGAAFLTVAVVSLLTAARHRYEARFLQFVGVVGCVGVSLAVAAAFAGPNVWYDHSAYGLRGARKAISLAGLPLRDPAVWVLGVIAFTVLFALYRRLSGNGESGKGTVRSVAVAAPAVVAVAALGVSVSVLLVGFSAAPFRAGGTYSLAAENVAHLTGSSCGLADKVEVLADAPRGVRSPIRERSNSAQGRFVAQGGFPSTQLPMDKPGTGTSRHVWGNYASAEQLKGKVAAGGFTTPWFGLPSLRKDQYLGFSVGGRVNSSNGVWLEFRREGSTAVTPVRDIAGATGEARWRTAWVDPAAIPAGVDQVRIAVTDSAPDPVAWTAVTGPRILETTSLTDYLRTLPGPTLPSTRTAFITPCVRDIPRVAHGLAQAPTLLIEGKGPLVQGPAFESRSGVFTGVRHLGSAFEIPSRLRGRPGFDWGHLTLIRYPIAVDAYRTSLSTVRLPGWRGAHLRDG